MIELIIGYFYIAFVVFSVTKNKNAGLIWPVATLKFIIESILKIVSNIRLNMKKG